MGIEKVLPTWRDLEVFLQLLPRSTTAERMNPYTSFWTGVTPGRRPAGVPPRAARQRPDQRAGRPGRPPGAALHPLLGLPERLPGLRAHRRPRLRLGLPRADRRDPHAAARAASSTPSSLPFASSLCGACYEVCPVKIDIPACSSTCAPGWSTTSSPDTRREPGSRGHAQPAWTMREPRRWAGRCGSGRGAGGCWGGAPAGSGTCPVRWAPGPPSRDLPRPPRQTFRDWWRAERSR